MDKKNKVPTHRQSIGRWGENLAASYLQERGLTLLAQNARTPYGELDLVARQGQVTVFVEVKTRTSAAFGLPEVSITPTKSAHLLDAAQHFLLEHPELDGDWRIDVISIQGRPGQQNTQIEWFENAVT